MRKIILYSLIIFVTLFTISAFQIYKNLDNYEVSSYDKKEKQLKTIVNDANILSNALFDNVINTKQVIDVFKNAYKASNEKKINIRKNLYNLLADNYKDFKKYGIQQLHFHLPNNDSFLRFHKPSKFGDNLTNVRSSVKLVSKNKIPYLGFEEGRIFNGFRFVYPLFDEKQKYIGSVEISSSLLNFKKRFEQNNNPNIDYIMKKEIVEEKVFNDQLNNYKKYFSSDDFLVRKTIADYNYNCKHKEEKSFLLSKLFEDKKLVKRMKNFEKFYQIYIHNFEVYSINLVPLKNDFSNKNIGYRIMFSKSDYFEYFPPLYILIFIILILSILIAYFIYKEDKQKEKTEKLAMYDQLTNTYNRHYFDKKIKKEFELLKNKSSDLSLIMFDIDHFKLINDKYGHDVGDKSLIFLSTLIKDNIRTNDIFCRWGGEEFMILSKKPFDKSIVMAEYLRKTIDVQTDKSEDIPHFTCSFGVVSLLNVENIKEGIREVDELLYKSKKEGRNKVSS